MPILEPANIANNTENKMQRVMEFKVMYQTMYGYWRSKKRKSLKVEAGSFQEAEWAASDRLYGSRVDVYQIEVMGDNRSYEPILDA